MDILKALILGVVQGITEFMPISSSAHLVVFPKILNWPYWGKAFDVALHVGAFLAIILYYRKEVLALIKACFASLLERRLGRDPMRRLSWLLLLSAVPAAMGGVLLDKVIEENCSSVPLIALLLIIFAFILWLADRKSIKSNSLNDIGIREAVFIGLAQVLALFPGVSRSGVTMTAALALGLKRDAAADFSFLMSLPVVGGAALYEGLKLMKAGFPDLAVLPCITGVLASAVAGYLSIRFLLKFLSRRTFLPFVIYRWLLGAALLSWFFIK
jgi:undecaprenyl-diphosphatase